MPRPTAADLRALSAEELARLGDEALRGHLLAQAQVAHRKHAPLDSRSLEALLGDPDCLRHPLRIVFEFGDMALHQFAQPGPDWRDPTGDGRVLYLRPMLRNQPRRIALAVAYMIPVVNYGAIVGDDHCLLYGATLLGMTEDEFYRELCELADWLGAENRPRGTTGAS
jgi:hypothetical protein